MSNTPTTIGKYQIIREIARSNDIVYEAYDPLMNRRVAVKELAVPGGSTPQQKEDRVKRFLREARAAGSLQHPNIMTVFEVGEEAGRYFIAMEYLDGKTLRNELDTKGFLEPDRALEIAHGVLDGLAYAHSKGVIHRDIKPDNIQLTSNGGIKLTDFGIARLTFEPNLTMDGQVFGTPSYMSPEQVVGRDIDARSDLFSLGIVLYEMLAGAKPFPGDSVVAITYAIMNKHPDRPAQCNHAMWQVLERALDKSPQLRFRDADEFSQALKDAARASTSVVIDPVQPYQQPQAMNQPYAPTPYSAGNPYGASPAPPVIANPYAYSPYGPPQQTGAANPLPYVPNPAQVPYNQTVPVYYPPPPRTPLLSAGAKRVLKQLFGSILALSAVIAILIFAINWFSRAAERQLRANPPAAVPASGDSKRPIKAQAQPRPASKGAMQAAYDSNERGHQLWNDGRPVDAEKAFREAVRLEPDSPVYHANLAAVLFSRAQAEGDPSLQIEMYTEAGREFAMAAELETVARTKERTKLNAAEAYYESALLLANQGKAREARDRLWEARSLATGDPQLYDSIERLRTQLSSFR